MQLFYTLLLCAISASSFAQLITTHTVYFNLNQDKPTIAAEKDLMDLVGKLKEQPVLTIIVKGYADQTGSDCHNQKLSKRRADNVAALLQKVLPETVSLLSEYFGEHELITADEASQYLNRRVVLSISYQTKDQEEIEVEGFFKDVEEEQFSGELSDTILVKGRQGTTIRIPPGSLQTRTGEVVKGKVEVRLKEYYNPSDILLAGMHSVSDQGLLQTGGMFKVVLLQGSDTLSTETKKEVEIRMPIRDSSLSNMNVFVMNGRQDSTGWRNTNRPFSQTYRYWSWPWNEPRLEYVRPPGILWLDYFPVGKKYSDELNLSRPLIALGDWVIPTAKNVWLEIIKLDSVTFRVNTKIKYRNKGFRRFGIRSLDTTFIVQQRMAEYYSSVSSLNFINCDRFLNNKNNTDFYVQTPGFRGLNVMAYFKSQSAYMYAVGKKSKYSLNRIPADESVIVVAYGKSGDAYYFAKQPSIITRKGTMEITPQKMSKGEFENSLKSL